MVQITLQCCPCPVCKVENEIDVPHCHSCGRALRCARAQVLTVPLTPEPKQVKPQGRRGEKSPLVHCWLKVSAMLSKKHDISGLHFD